MSEHTRLALLGASAGALAIVPMTLTFWIARRHGDLDEMPPRKAIRSVFPKLHEPMLSATSAAAHVAVGAAAAGAYSSLMPRRRHGVLSGIVMGLLVWFVGYEGVMPRATDVAPAHRDRRDRALSILVAHVVFGATTGLTLKLLERAV